MILPTCWNHRNGKFWSIGKGYVLVVERIAQIKWEQNKCESGTVKGFQLGLVPLPVIVIISIFTFLVEDSTPQPSYTTISGKEDSPAEKYQSCLSILTISYPGCFWITGIRYTVVYLLHAYMTPSYFGTPKRLPNTKTSGDTWTSQNPNQPYRQVYIKVHHKNLVTWENRAPKD